MCHDILLVHVPTWIRFHIHMRTGLNFCGSNRFHHKSTNCHWLPATLLISSRRNYNLYQLTQVRFHDAFHDFITLWRILNFIFSESFFRSVNFAWVNQINDTDKCRMNPDNAISTALWFYYNAQGGWETYVSFEILISLYHLPGLGEYINTYTYQM